MEDNSQIATAAAESAETTTGSMSAGPQARPSSEEAEEAKTPTEGADTELEGLALSSDITELAYALEAVSTLIFEIQEIRHTASNTSQSATQEGETTEVDASLLKLEDHLETTTQQVDDLQARLNTYFKKQTAGLLRQKWEGALASWQKLQKEAEDMREELVEDKYLTVYRTVSRQAEDMMQSLEKVFAQCNTFVHETYKSRRVHPNPSSEDLQKQLNTFIGLHKSLHQKTTYYIPSCEKVLKVIDSGISQQKRSLNGEILRSHADMKLRWRNLQERMSRTEKEMLGVQELLSDLSAKVTRADQQAISDGITSSSASTSSHKSSASTPSRSSVTTARNKVGDWLSPSPSRQSGDGKASEPVDSPLHSRSITPFRRLANRLQRSKTSEGVSPPTVYVPVPVPSVSSSSRASHSPESQRTPLPKEKVGLGHPTPTQSAPSMPRTASSPATVDRQQRRYSKMPIAGPSSTPDVPPPRPSYLSSAKSERARSPIPPPRSSSSIGTAVSERPPWNAGTRLPQDSFLGASLPASTAAKGRKSLPGGTIRNPTARYSHLPSGYSQARPQSRIFTTPSASFRAPSPTFSATSNTSASASRLRPSSPNSRIPAPGSSGDMPRRDGRNVHHGSPNGGEDVETLYFGARNEEGGDSLMQRALSPTLSQSGFSVTSSTGGGTPGGNRRHSRIPRLSLGDAQLPDPQMLNIPPPPKIPAVYAGRSEIMTPEPALRSKAARVSAMYGRPSMSARKSLGHGSMPPLSSEFMASPQPQRSLTASTSGMRPSSRLSVGTGVGGGGRRSSFYAPSTSSRLATPLPDVPGGSLYYPNKHDPLDSEIAEIVNSQPLYVYCQREDPQLSKAAAEAQAPSDRMAKYWLAHNDNPILCKLIDRGDRKPKKVLCKIAGEWQDLSLYLLNQQAQY